MKLAMGLLPLLVLALAAVADAQLFKHIKHFDPSKVKVPLAKKTPAEIVKDVEAAVPKDLTGKIQDALNASSAETVKDAAVDKIGEAFQDITGKSNVSQAVDSTKSQQKELAEAMAKAGAALQRTADVIGNASSSDVQSSLKGAGSQAADSSDLASVKDALGKASKQDVADELRKVTPEAAGAVDRTSQQVSEKLREASPKAVALVNRTGNKVAEAISPKHIPDSEDIDPFDSALGGRGWVGLAGVVVLLLTAGAAYLVSLRFKRSQRSPVLLSDALDTAQPVSGSRGRNTVQMTTQEPFFSQF